MNRTTIRSLPEDQSVEVLKLETENWRNTLKKLFIVTAALISLSGFAYADINGSQGRNYDLRESDTYTGPFSTKKVNSWQIEAYRAVNVTGNNDADIREQHRLNEKH